MPPAPSASTISVSVLSAPVPTKDLKGSDILKSFNVPTDTAGSYDILSGSGNEDKYLIAFAPKVCDSGGVGAQMGMGFCEYTKVWVTKAKDGIGWVGSASGPEWKVGGTDLKAVRDSFDIAEAAVEVEVQVGE